MAREKWGRFSQALVQTCLKLTSQACVKQCPKNWKSVDRLSASDRQQTLQHFSNWQVEMSCQKPGSVTMKSTPVCNPEPLHVHFPDSYLRGQIMEVNTNSSWICPREKIHFYSVLYTKSATTSNYQGTQFCRVILLEKRS